MGYAQTTFLGDGNFFYNTSAQNGVYQNHSFTSPLEWRLDYSAPTPTGAAIVAPTNGVNFPHTMFMGSSDGFWVHRVFLDGHLTRTFTMVDQQFAIPMQYDRIESVAMPFSPPETGVTCGHGHGDCPAPAGFTVILAGAFVIGGRKRKH